MYSALDFVSSSCGQRDAATMIPNSQIDLRKQGTDTKDPR